MDQDFLNILLAFAAVLLPTGLAAFLIELRARRDDAQRRMGRREASGGSQG